MNMGIPRTNRYMYTCIQRTSIQHSDACGGFQHAISIRQCSIHCAIKATGGGDLLFSYNLVSYRFDMKSNTEPMGNYIMGNKNWELPNDQSLFSTMHERQVCVSTWRKLLSPHLSEKQLPFTQAKGEIRTWSVNIHHNIELVQYWLDAFWKSLSQRAQDDSLEMIARKEKIK